MGRQRKGRRIDGWLVLDKPAGMTSARAVDRVRRLLDARKAGHAGTLDPIATGVLPIALGEATKTTAYLVDADKTYEFTVRWGEGRDTDDAEGTVVADGGRIPGDDEIDQALAGFVGTIDQVPPDYAAVKVGGRRAYDLARSGKPAEQAARRVTVHELARTGPGEDGLTPLRMRCGKGVYVRAVARDLARNLGTYAHIAALERTQVGKFTRDQAISLEKLEQFGHSAPAEDLIQPVASALVDIPALAVTEQEAKRLSFGQRLRLPTSMDGTVCVTHNGVPVAIARVAQGNVHPVRVLNMKL